MTKPEPDNDRRDDDAPTAATPRSEEATLKLETASIDESRAIEADTDSSDVEAL